MHYHIILTEKCNSKCKYCYEKSMNEFENGLDKKWKFDFSAPCDSEVSVEKLKKFLNAGDTIIFYGGEPLVNFKKMKEIMDGLQNSGLKFCIQTNGKLLNEIPYEYIKKMDKMLVSIDGDKKRTDYNKGKGTYDAVVGNLRELREKGFQNEIVARMTISPEFSDLYEQVNHLTSLGIFDSIHWQIDAGFYKNDFDEKKFSEFADKYNSSVEKLIGFWIEKMKKGKVLRLYPFMGILNRLMGWDKETRMHCGSGYANYTITTDGKITSCPIMNNVAEFYAGNLESEKLKQFDLDEPCDSCDYKNICGGRCLYWNKAKLWPEEGDKLICKTIIFLIEKLKNKIPEIKKLISSGKISEKNFEYEKYFGPEIIP
jgi:putative peptide-modifying radical SAM enzyme